MHATLLEQVPIGTSAADARQIMEREGFQCILQRDGAISENEKVEPYEACLFCSRDNYAGSPWISREWRIALILDNDHVVDVRVNSYLTGA